MAKQYTRNTWVNDAPPAINATNLNNVEEGVLTNNRLDLSVAHDITVDSDYTLTTEQNQYGRIEITDIGVLLTTTRNIVMNNDEHTFLFINSTAQALTVKTSAGTGVTVSSGAKAELRNNGTDVIEYEAAISLLGALDTSNMIHVQETQASGVASADGSSVAGSQVRTLNTVVTNTISGASLSANQIILPAGTYLFFGKAPAYAITTHRLSVEDVTNANFYRGYSQRNTGSNVFDFASVITPLVTIGATANFRLSHYTQGAGGSLGSAAGDTASERYSELIAYKVG